MQFLENKWGERRISDELQNTGVAFGLVPIHLRASQVLLSSATSTLKSFTRRSFFPRAHLAYEVIRNMAVWQIEYFEVGASTPYLRERFFSVNAKDVAVRRFVRLGGDDFLKITSSKMVLLNRLKEVLHSW